MMGLPMGCLESCLCARKVACFRCAESRKEFMQLSAKPLVSIGALGLPAEATFPRQATLSCLEGCLPKERGR